MKRFLFIALVSLAVFGTPAFAQTKKKEPEIPKDLKARTSLDYTLDDGIMSKAEMEMEAMDMYEMCNKNPYQKRLFDCSCIAGAFLQQREKLGPMVMQYEIFERITNSKYTSASCANTESVAGRVYNSCLNFAQNYSKAEFDPNTEEYCTCTANKVARDFARQPRLSGQYIEQLRGYAMNICKDPKIREQLRAQTAQDEAAKKAAASNAVPAINKTTN